jgi:hypothetical protein
MKKTENLVVYKYLYWDVASGRVKASDMPATLDAITSGFCEPILDSAQVVPRAAVYHKLVSLRRKH